MLIAIIYCFQTYVETYEGIVSDHQQYSKAVMETQEWLEATNSTIMLWGDSDLERISLHSNIERLKVRNHWLLFNSRLNLCPNCRVCCTRCLRRSIGSNQLVLWDKRLFQAQLKMDRKTFALKF